jgi:hypothetical protein
VNAITPPPTPQESTAFARRRDALVLALLDQHPATADDLAGLGWFPSPAKAARRLARLAARGKVRLVGTVALKPGRPQHVYCRWRVKADALAHEVLLTRVCLKLHATRVLRGPRVQHRDVRADAEVWVGGRLFFLELDRGTMGHAQLARRYATYAGRPEFVLWVCSTRERREAMRERAEAIRSTALFATLADAVADPHAAVWLDFSGRAVALPRA